MLGVSYPGRWKTTDGVFGLGFAAGARAPMAPASPASTAAMAMTRTPAGLPGGSAAPEPDEHGQHDHEDDDEHRSDHCNSSSKSLTL